MVVFVAVSALAGEAIEPLPEFVFGLVLGSIFGTSFGVTQWWVLRGQLQPVAPWIGATLVGFLVGATIIFGLMDGGNPNTPLITKLGHAVVLGSALGIAQWFALRQKVDQAGLWIVISIVA